MSQVKGRYVDHSLRNGFFYAYTCERCKRTFQSSAPEAHEPVLCHACFTGAPLIKRRLNRKRVK